MLAQEIIKILFLAANPQAVAPLQIDEEMRAVDQALRLAAHRDRFDLRTHWAVRYGDLQELLLRHQPHILHFSGHGSPAGEIILVHEGGVHPVSAATLGALFAILKDNLHCVVLNACYSEVQAQAIAAQVDCVVGMSDAIGDDAARHFSAAFYLALGYGRSVQAAFDLGCNALDLASLAASAVPKLLTGKQQAAEIVLVRQTAAQVDRRAALTTLRNLLSELYPDETSARRIVVDAGLDARRIAFSAQSLNSWHSILTEAGKVNGIAALIEVVLLEYGENPQLQAAWAAFRTDPAVG